MSDYERFHCNSIRGEVIDNSTRMFSMIETIERNGINLEISAKIKKIETKKFSLV